MLKGLRVDPGLGHHLFFFLHLPTLLTDVTKSHDFKIHLLICGPPLVKEKGNMVRELLSTMYWQWKRSPAQISLGGTILKVPLGELRAEIKKPLSKAKSPQRTSSQSVKLMVLSFSITYRRFPLEEFKNINVLRWPTYKISFSSPAGLLRSNRTSKHH